MLFDRILIVVSSSLGVSTYHICHASTPCYHVGRTQSVCVSEVEQSLDDHLSPISLLVAMSKVNRVDAHNDNDQEVARYRSIAPRAVQRSILAAKYQGSSNPPNPTKADQRCTAERTFPLPTNVVRLICHSCWDVRVGTCCNEEDAEIAYRVARMKSLLRVSFLHHDLAADTYHDR
jgi:hypothetical protein